MKRINKKLAKKQRKQIALKKKMVGLRKALSIGETSITKHGTISAEEWQENLKARREERKR